MASSSSSAAADAAVEQHHHHHYGGGVPAPPPPTPSNHTHSLTSHAADAALSRFLCQLTPTLSLSTPPSRLSLRLSSSSAPTKPQHRPTPPVISLLQRQEGLVMSAASDLGFFHLTDHGIPSHLPTSVHLESQSLFHSHPRELSPIGFDFDGGDDSSFLVLDTAVTADSGHRPALTEYARHLERVGMEVVEMLSCAGGFKNPSPEKRSGTRCLMWISSTAKSVGGGDDDEEDDGGSNNRGGGASPWGRSYPYVVCLQYEMRSWSKCLLLGDDPGWVTVEPQADSVLVTIGDIAQVWSNGRFKKVRGRPSPSFSDDDEGDSSCITMSLLVTLPTDSVISPKPSATDMNSSIDDDEVDGDVKKFCTFPFEQYAWRLYHEQFPFKDPLHRYRL